MNRYARPYLVIALVLFAAAALVHAGVLVSGHEHPRARIAEGVIAVVLAIGLAVALTRPALARAAALAALGFALMGTLVGAFTIWIGIGPQTPADIVFHALLVIVLVSGLALNWRDGP
jgi:hypothetical protein